MVTCSMWCGSRGSRVDDELKAAVGASGADQLSAQLVDLADVMGNFRDRLIAREFPKTLVNEMVGQWFQAYLWPGCGCVEE